MMCSVFSFSEEYLDSPYDISPNRYPKDKIQHRTFYGNKAFEGLPEFLADSLPDDWGNTLFDKWTSDNKIPLNDMRSLMKLSFIGSRGMGALEYVPSLDESDVDPEIDVNALYKVAMGVLHNRETVSLSQGKDALTFKKLILLGTSVGGKHAKGLIAMNQDGQIRSGQIPLPNDFKYYILKFKESEDVPTSEIELIFHKMAMDAGIKMMPSTILNVSGTNHFLTERFDRVAGGEKVFTQTLRALSPSANDYMNIFWLCDSLHVPTKQKEQVFRQMVFNFIAGVTDDHSRNFSFLMDKDGNWSVSPAYDVMFTQNTWESPAAAQHCLGMWQKRSFVTLSDFVDFGEDIGFENTKAIVEQVSDTVCSFNERCLQMNIEGKWTTLIGKVIQTLIPVEFLHKWTNIPHDKPNTNMHSFDEDSASLPKDFSDHIELIGRYDGMVELPDGTVGAVQKIGDELRFQDSGSIAEAIRQTNLIDGDGSQAFVVDGKTYALKDPLERYLEILPYGKGAWVKDGDGEEVYLAFSIERQRLIPSISYEDARKEVIKRRKKGMEEPSAKKKSTRQSKGKKG